MTAPVSHPLRVLRVASIIEGATLLARILIAVPLKRMADLPLAVSIVGPIHGAAFLIYTALVLQSLWSRLISVSEAARLMVVARSSTCCRASRWNRPIPAARMLCSIRSCKPSFARSELLWNCLSKC